MLARLRRTAAALTLGLVLAGGVAAVSSSDAAAATADGRSCHHSIRTLPGFLNEEVFTGHYRAGIYHYHDLYHVDWKGSKHRHTVRCGIYTNGKLSHWLGK